MGFSSGGNKSKQVSQSTDLSENKAFEPISSAFSPNFQFTGQAGNQMAGILGLNGSALQDDAFRKFLDSSGYNFLQNEGQRAVTANRAFRGLLDSGSFAKGLADRSQSIASTFLDQYLNRLASLANIGAQSGQLVAGAGQYRTGQSSSEGSSKGRNFGFQLG